MRNPDAGSSAPGRTGLPQPPAVAPVPRVAVEAFCETAAVAEALRAAGADRRMSRAKLNVHMGGIEAARAAYSEATSPNVVVIETPREHQAVVAELDAFAEVCEADTRVIVIGHVNDIFLYRDLMRRGISDYLIAPVQAIDLVAAISEIFSGQGAKPIGRTIAVIGAKGGVGSSTIAHNLASLVARSFSLSTAIVDLDIAFGTAGLDFNQDPPQTVTDALFAPERIDANFVDRLLTKCGDNLNLLAAPAMLDRAGDIDPPALELLLDILRSSTPMVVVDLPHAWTHWVRHVLIDADEILVVAAPDLANLRNAKNLVDTLRQSRPSDRAPHLVLNGVGLPRRPEIPVGDFVKALGVEPRVTIPFDAQLFGTAANNGQMIAEVQASGKIAGLLEELAAAVAGRSVSSTGRATLLKPFIARLARRKA